MHIVQRTYFTKALPSGRRVTDVLNEVLQQGPGLCRLCILTNNITSAVRLHYVHTLKSQSDILKFTQFFRASGRCNLSEWSVDWRVERVSQATDANVQRFLLKSLDKYQANRIKMDIY